MVLVESQVRICVVLHSPLLQYGADEGQSLAIRQVGARHSPEVQEYPVWHWESKVQDSLQKPLLQKGVAEEQSESVEQASGQADADPLGPHHLILA